MGSKTLPDQGRQVATGPGWEAFFSWIWVWGIVPLPRVLSKSFLSSWCIKFSHAYSKNKDRRLSPICSTATECPQWSVRSPGRSDFRDSAGTPCRCPCSGKRSGSSLYFPELFSESDYGSWPLCLPGRSRCSPADASARGRRCTLETRKPQGARHAPHP